MGEILWMKFLEEEIEDLQIVILTIGINGLLRCFEDWLKDNDYLKENNFNEKEV
jgi:hypothetical protein